jgi:hypothetical protein
MKWLGEAARAWDVLWFSPASPYPIAAFRMLLGGYLLAYLATLAPHVPVLFSSEGVYAPYLVPDYAPGPALAWLFFAAFVALTLALTLGYRTARVIPALLVVYLYHYFLALGVKHSSFERLLVIYLLALWPSHADAVWAVSAPRQVADRPATYSFAGRLLRFQTIVLYLGAGLWKAANPAWRDGTLLLSTLQGIWASPLSFWLVQRGFTLHTWSLVSRGVIAGEIVAGCLFWLRPTRPLAILLGTLFHLGNSVILVIPEFLVCLAPYVFFLREQTVERIGSTLAARLTPRFRRRSRAGE